MVIDRDMEKAVKLYQDKKMGGSVQMKNQFLEKSLGKSSS